MMPDFSSAIAFLFLNTLSRGCAGSRCGELFKSWFRENREIGSAAFAAQISTAVSFTAKDAKSAKESPQRTLRVGISEKSPLRPSR
jgi:hypothetical protein